MISSERGLEVEEVDVLEIFFYHIYEFLTTHLFPLLLLLLLLLFPSLPLLKATSYD